MWKNLNIYEIKRLENPVLRKEYEGKRFTYMYGVSMPICSYLENQGLKFNYSKSPNQMTLQEMANELKLFCEENNIHEEERHAIVYNELERKQR